MKLTFSFLWIASLLLSHKAIAQRGLTTDEPTSDTSPNRNVPSFFDTQMIETGRFSFDFPSFQIDYGINSRWSVGVNALTLIPLLSLRTPLTLGIKARHAIYSSEQWHAVISGQFFQIPFAKTTQPMPNEDSGTSRIAWASLNISRMHNSNEFGLSTSYAHLNLSQVQKKESSSSKSRTHGLASAVWWRWHSGNHFGTEFVGFIAPAIFEYQNNPVINAQSRAIGLTGFSFIRSLVNWRASDKWLWFAGAVLFPELESVTLPYLGFAFTFPEAETPEHQEELP